jgi:hypothetical protein
MGFPDRAPVNGNFVRYFILDTELTSLEILSIGIVALLLDSEPLVGLEVLQIDRADAPIIEYVSLLPHLRCLIISGMSPGERAPLFLSEEVNTVTCEWDHLFTFTSGRLHTLHIPASQSPVYSNEEVLLAYAAFHSMSRLLCILKIADYLVFHVIDDFISPALESLTLEHWLRAEVPHREVSSFSMVCCSDSGRYTAL